MRDIKFRVWDNDTDYMGYLYPDMTYMEGTGKWLIDDLGETLNMDDKTIELYTGVKDINGVEIYEGDLILAKSIEYEVEWFNTSFWAIPYSGVGSSQPISNLYEYDGNNVEKIEVIGNIHEDETLLH